MSAISYRKTIRSGALCIAGVLLSFGMAMAQDSGLGQTPLLLADDDNQVSQQTLQPVLTIERQAGQSDLQGLYGDETVNLNLGIEYRPIDGLSLRADAWRFESGDNPAQAANGDMGFSSRIPQPYLQEAGVGEFSLDQSFYSSSVETEGIDLGASFSWATDKVGQFTLSTRATFISDFEQQGVVPISALSGTDVELLPGKADLQGSLMLTWKLGNHSASAVTNYFDSVKDVSELNMDEINQLVEDITTVDLQYGYNLKTGKQDQAVISFSLGIRNIFDKKTTQILNQNSRVVDQNGRVAYGSIKYQF